MCRASSSVRVPVPLPGPLCQLLSVQPGPSLSAPFLKGRCVPCPRLWLARFSGAQQWLLGLGVLPWCSAHTGWPGSRASWNSAAWIDRWLVALPPWGKSEFWPEPSQLLGLLLGLLLPLCFLGLRMQWPGGGDWSGWTETREWLGLGLGLTGERPLCFSSCTSSFTRLLQAVHWCPRPPGVPQL